MKKIFDNISCYNLLDEDCKNLVKMRHRRKNSKYKIIVTSDRCDYDNLSELADYPERGKKVGTFYYNNLEEAKLIIKCFEGLFYQLFEVERTERIGSGVLDDFILYECRYAV